MTEPQLGHSEDDQGTNRFRFHKFQSQAWRALETPTIREVALIAGLQGGKSSFGAVAMLSHMIGKCPYPDANFIIGAPTYPVLEQSTLPTFRRYIGASWGAYNSQKKEFTLGPTSKIYFRTSTDPNQCEGIPNCYAAWIDEAGMCSRLFYINVLGRIARLQGQVLYTSTPYAMNWLYHDVIKPYRNGSRDDIFVTQFTSADNPSFPKEEFERQRALLDARTFRRKYMGVHEKMQGLVYELGPEHYVDPVELPTNTVYYGGIDFGFAEGHEFALIVRAITPNGTHYDISEFKEAGVDPARMVEIVKSKSEMFHVKQWYADPARPDLISMLNKSKVPAIGFHVGKENYKKIIPGIEKHIELIKAGRYRVFNTCRQAMDEYETYHFKENDDGRVAKEVPVAENDHCFDVGTLVHTTKGRVPIESLVGHEGFLHSRDGRICRFHSVRPTRKDCDIVHIHLNDNQTLSVTPDHLVLLKSGEWIESQLLNAGDWIQSDMYEGQSSFSAKARVLGAQLLQVSRRAIFQGISDAKEAIVSASSRLGIPQWAYSGWNAHSPQRQRRVEQSDFESRTNGPQSSYQSPYDPRTACSPGEACRQDKTANQEMAWVKRGQEVALVTWKKDHGPKNTNQKKLRALPQKLFYDSISKVGSFLRGQLQNEGAHKTVKGISRGRSAVTYNMEVDGAECLSANGVIAHNCMDAIRYVTVGTMHVKMKRKEEVIVLPKRPVIDTFDPRKKTRSRGFDSY